jgi:hypothetical protein
MKRLGAILLVLALGGCGTIQGLWKPKPRAAAAAAPACPAGQEHLRTAQLFSGRQTAGMAITPWDLQRFVDQEITPRFPDGVTVLDGGAQWQGNENILIRDAAKVVLIVLPARGDPQNRVEAVRAAYRQRFNQETVLVVTPPTCVEF